MGYRISVRIYLYQITVKRGSIKNVEIYGDRIHEVDAFGVAGRSFFEGEVDIARDLFVNGAVTCIC